MEWRPIETAPKDGTEFLIYEECCGKDIFEVVSWHNGKLVVSWDLEEFDLLKGKAYFWHPLPKRPPK